MLARTFLTAKQLHCSQVELDAAISVLGMLERGELQQVPIEALTARAWVTRTWVNGDWKPITKPIPSDAFNISCWQFCIAGWMERTKGRQLSQQCSQRWRDLFEPDGWDSCEEYFTTERCARALQAKLTTGKAVWD